MDRFITADEVEAKVNNKEDLEKFANYWQPMPEIVEKNEKFQNLTEELKLINHEIKAMDSMEKQWLKKSIRELKENINKHEIELLEKNCQKNAAQAELFALKVRKELEELKHELEELRKISEELKQIQIVELEKMAMTAKMAKSKSMKESYQKPIQSKSTVKTPVATRKSKQQQPAVTPSPNIIVTRSKSRTKR